MTQADFYILSLHGDDERLAFVCRLVDKAYRRGHSIYIHVDDSFSAKALDNALWQWRPDRFLPHDICEAGTDWQAGALAIGIGHQACPAVFHDMLINLANDIPPFFSRFLRVAEVATQETDVLAHVRSHYRVYRERGYPVKVHEL